MTMPGFTAEASVYATSESIPDRSAGMGFEQPGSVGRHVHMHGPWMHVFVPVTTTTTSSSGLSPTVCWWP